MKALSKKRTSAEDITRYFSQLGSLFKETQVTDAKGTPLEFSRGMQEAIDLIQKQSALGKKLIFIGNGGSSSIASHQVTDFCKNGGIRAIAFTDASLLTCLSNDIGYPYVFEKSIELHADSGDVLFAISSSGRSENILRGVSAAKDKACEIITMSGFTADNPLRKGGRLNFFVPSNSYGHVEISHLTICHCMVDMLVEKGQYQER
ncbi:MAG TPA: SIS domain-containing protein [Candidatus Tripitaka californicus]|uniref:SIS domain-containing protein n=1 Tax=Candidatus Tripitaka californicus TaxID=3367616 RepID=UPI004027479F